MNPICIQVRKSYYISSVKTIEIADKAAKNLPAGKGDFKQFDALFRRLIS